MPPPGTTSPIAVKASHRVATACLLLAAMAAVLAAGCGGTSESVLPLAQELPSDSQIEHTTTTSTSTTSSSTTTSTTSTSTTTTSTTTTSSTSTTNTSSSTTSDSPTTTVGFESSVEPLNSTVLDRVVGTSWSPGCPVDTSELRYVLVTHNTPDGGTTVGELVVHERVAADVVGVFKALFESGFSIESMRLVDDFDADDLRSMQANNTSGFNCRFVEGTTSWSWHAYGLAIDLNPLTNPYVTPAGVSPPEGAAYIDRTLDVPGLIVAGDAATTAFEAIGWEWGGDWSYGQDYQHFAARNG